MALEAEDRTEDLVEQKKVKFDGVQSIAQMPRKAKGQCRMVVELPFDFSKEYLAQKSEDHDAHYADGVDLLRKLKSMYERGTIDLNDLVELSAAHSDNGVRMEAAK